MDRTPRTNSLFSKLKDMGIRTVPASRELCAQLESELIESKNNIKKMRKALESAEVVVTAFYGGDGKGIGKMIRSVLKDSERVE